MGKIQSSLNANLVMASGANVIEYLAIKVPRSDGAKAVFLVECEIDVAVPDNVATDSEGVCYGLILLGKQTPVSTSLATAGALTTRSLRKVITDTTLGESIQYVYDGPSHKRGMYDIQADPDGTYYITLAVNTSGCVAVQSAAVRLDFVIVK